MDTATVCYPLHAVWNAGESGVFLGSCSTLLSGVRLGGGMRIERSLELVMELGIRDMGVSK